MFLHSHVLTKAAEARTVRIGGSETRNVFATWRSDRSSPRCLSFVRRIPVIFASVVSVIAGLAADLYEKTRGYRKT
jgi:hypothetical protein